MTTRATTHVKQQSQATVKSPMMATGIRKSESENIFAHHQGLHEVFRKPLISRPPLLQHKLIIGQPNDRYEREADQVADRVMRMPAPVMPQQAAEEREEEELRLQAKSLTGITPLVQRQCKEDGLLQTKGVTSRAPKVGANIESRLQSLRNGGQSLSETSRAFFEPRFGHDFSQVRIHSDATAAQLAQSLRAKAFTLGRHVVFGSGQYAPENGIGRQLLAHELTHVIQQEALQGGNSQPHIQCSPTQTVSPEFHFGEFSGHDSATDEELQEQLDEGDISWWSIYQDDRAREIVRRWLTPNYPTFKQLDIDQRILLIRQMLSGATLDDDERAILELLRAREITNPDRKRIVAAIGRDRLLLDFHGSEDERLREILQEIDRAEPQEQCTLATTEATPQCDAAQSASEFPLRDSAVAGAIINGLAETSVSALTECNFIRAVPNIIELLSHSPTFLEVARRVEQDYFCHGGRSIRFHFHAESRIGSHFERGEPESSIEVEYGGPGAEDQHIALIRTIVHEVVHASHQPSAARPAALVRGVKSLGGLGRLVESEIAEEASTRDTENAIMQEIAGHSAWRALVGREITTADLQQSEAKRSTVRRDFASGLPRLTYAEKYIVEEMLRRSGRSVSEEDKTRIEGIATRARELGLVPETITANNASAFDFGNPATLSKLRGRVRHTETCPTGTSTSWVAPPHDLFGCLKHYYQQGRSRLSNPTYRDTGCQAFIVAHRADIDGSLYRLYQRCAYRGDYFDYRSTVITWERDIKQRNPMAERQRCLTRNRNIESQNQQIQPIIDIASGRNRRYFEWIVIRQVISNEWVHTEGTSGGERTEEQNTRIRAIQDTHLAFLRIRIGRPLRGYTYEQGPSRRRRRKQRRGKSR